jgi:hypothetical protein
MLSHRQSASANGGWQLQPSQTHVQLIPPAMQELKQLSHTPIELRGQTVSGAAPAEPNLTPPGPTNPAITAAPATFRKRRRLN